MRSSPSDLAAHAGEWAEPLRARYRDAEIAELPPPTQGVSALEALRILDGFEDLGAVDAVTREHLRIEAFKAAMADRDRLGHGSDRDAGRRPTAMLSDEWVSARRAAIDPEQGRDTGPGEAPARRHGVPLRRRR